MSIPGRSVVEIVLSEPERGRLVGCRWSPHRFPAVRSSVERTYRACWQRAEIDPADRATMTTDDHRRTFTAFIGELLADFDQYLAHEPTDPTADGVTYQQ